MGCICGAELVEMSVNDPSLGYDCSEVRCDHCCADVPMNGRVYHCPQGKSAEHAMGYDICCGCAGVDCEFGSPAASASRPGRASEAAVSAHRDANIVNSRTSEDLFVDLTACSLCETVVRSLHYDGMCSACWYVLSESVQDAAILASSDDELFQSV